MWQENWEWVETGRNAGTQTAGRMHGKPQDRWYIGWTTAGETAGGFDHNGYSASLTASMRITPDEEPSATASLGSGYGVQEKVTAKSPQIRVAVTAVQMP
ncbi:MAG: hypothetical protein ACLSB9_36655 [Hydrogeniiclostridium mannosilyticum]